MNTIYILRLKKIADFYIYERISEPNMLDNLKNLFEEISGDEKNYINYIKKGTNISGNQIYTDQRNGKIYLGNIYASDYPDPNEFEIPTATLITLIEKFVQLAQLEPPYIVLSEENGVFSLEAKEII